VPRPRHALLGGSKCAQLSHGLALPCTLQVPIFQLLGKFNGVYETDEVLAGRRQFRLTRCSPLPAEPRLLQALRCWAGLILTAGTGQGRAQHRSQHALMQVAALHDAAHAALHQEQLLRREEPHPGELPSEKPGAERRDPSALRYCSHVQHCALAAQHCWSPVHSMTAGGCQLLPQAGWQAQQLRCAVLTADAGKGGAPLPSKYDLIANIVHEGSRTSAQTGSYKLHVQRQSEQQWYEVQDLVVNDILPQVGNECGSAAHPVVLAAMRLAVACKCCMASSSTLTGITPCLLLQMVALSEAYMQVYELKREQPAGQQQGGQEQQATAMQM